MFTLTYLSPLRKIVVSTLLLRALCHALLLVDCMLEVQSGKLMVYASRFSSRGNRLKPVSLAAEKMARLLNAGFEVKMFGKRFRPIYVYYKSGDEEPIPIYCSNGEESDMQEVYMSLRNMIFVLSFHPKQVALRQARGEIIRFS